MNVMSRCGWALLPAVLSGCASIPDVTLIYYPTAWSVGVSVTQTVGCVDQGRTPLFLHSVSVTPSYYRAEKETPYAVRVTELDRWFADAEMAVTFTDDGRLKAVNQSATGQGEAIVTSMVTALSAAGASPVVMGAAGAKTHGFMAAGPKEPKKPEGSAATKENPPCKLVKEWGGGDPVTLSYAAALDGQALSKAIPLEPAVARKTFGQSIPFQPTAASKALHERMQAALPPLTLVPGALVDIASGALHNGDPKAPGTVPLTLQRMATVTLRVEANGAQITTAAATVPRLTTYTLPMPKAALFGKQSFSLSLADSGAVLSVGYGKASGSAAALNTLGTLATARTTADATQAAALQAEADLIVQQQRVMRCRMDRSKCE